MRYRRLPIVLSVVAVAAGCSSGGAATPTLPAVAPARVYTLAGFTPAGAVRAGRPVTLSFTVKQPSGAPLVRYRTRSGPHTGVHLIVVRDDLSTIIHRHPPVARDGRVTQRLVLPKPGPYRVLVDVYPAHRGPGYVNYQLVRTIRAAGRYQPRPLPPFRPRVLVDGYRFTLHHVPKLRVAQAAIMTVTVTDPAGRPGRFTPWYGALAHAIFFRKGDLAYFHTHVCSPGLAGCASIVAGTQVSGSSTRPGVLRVGVLVPEAGTWRLFLQCQVHGRILTAPFTLHVR